MRELRKIFKRGWFDHDVLHVGRRICHRESVAEREMCIRDSHEAADAMLAHVLSKLGIIRNCGETEEAARGPIGVPSLDVYKRQRLPSSSAIRRSDH